MKVIVLLLALPIGRAVPPPVNLTTNANVSLKGTKHCSGRGGCDCDCGWASSQTCQHDDGSCCFGCCCGSSPSPTPTPGPPPGPPTPGATYCPGASDFAVDYGSPQLNAGGYHIQGGARVRTAASFDFAGGFIEFDMDLSNAHGNVNNNAYFTFPRDGHTYCDSGGSAPGCAEFDLTEDNGNCFQATTWHSNRGGGDHGGQAHTGGIGSQVHVKCTWNGDGSQATVQVGGNSASGEGFADVMSQQGATFYSSQWTGWVPGSCGGDGNLGASSFTVSNLRIKASVKQGKEPAKCNDGVTNSTSFAQILV